MLPYDSTTRMIPKYMWPLALVECEDGVIIIHGFSVTKLQTLYKAFHRNAKCEMVQDGFEVTYKFDVSFTHFKES